MSRYNNSKRKSGEDIDKKIVHSATKTFFSFEIPHIYNKFKKEIYKFDIDYHFFDKVVNPIYYRKPQRLFNPSFVEDSVKCLSYLYLESKDAKFRTDQLIIDEKYFVNGWAYPRKILQITFASVIFLLVYGGLMLPLTEYDFSREDGLYWQFSKIKYVLYVIVSIVTIWFWLRKYINKLPDIVNGSHSIDGYCWSFFHFRVQYLNQHNIIPQYFSRGFLRYFKGYIYILECRRLLTKTTNDNELCSICRPSQGIVRQLKKEDGRLDNYCNRCIKNYENDLFRAIPFSNVSNEFHKVIRKQIKSKSPLANIIDGDYGL